MTKLIEYFKNLHRNKIKILKKKKRKILRCKVALYGKC